MMMTMMKLMMVMMTTMMCFISHGWVLNRDMYGL